MNRGTAFRRNSFQRVAIGLLACFAIAISQSCARPDAFHRAQTNTGSSSGTQKLPFHPSADHASDDAARPAVPLDHKVSDSAPFLHLTHAGVPVGTLLTVRLERSLSVAQADAGAIFHALVAAPVVLDGEMLIPAGASVTGRVEGAQIPSPAPANQPATALKPALVRMRLSAVTIDGKQLPLQTSSLFAKAMSPQSAPVPAGVKPVSVDYRLLKGRELTFRLVSPLIFSDVSSVADRHYSDSSN